MQFVRLAIASGAERRRHTASLFSTEEAKKLSELNKQREEKPSVGTE